MKFLRWVLGALILAFGLLCVLMGGLNVAHKLGALKTVPADLQRLVPLWDATPWWQLGLWGLVALLLLMTAMRLFSGGKAFMTLLLAIAGEVVLWWFMHATPAYQAAFTKQELMYDYYTMGALGVALVIVWLSERGK